MRCLHRLRFLLLVPPAIALKRTEVMDIVVLRKLHPETLHWLAVARDLRLYDVDG